MFEDRLDAAARLAERLQPLLQRLHCAWPLVLAIPRGAVPMARLLAQQLHGQFDVVLVRKMRAPFSPETAIGALAEDGRLHLAPWAASMGADAAWIEQERQLQQRTLAQRRAQYDAVRTPMATRDRCVIVVDDGLATGATMKAALHAVRIAGCQRLVCAVPVASAEAATEVAPLADHFVCLHRLSDFGAVGNHYRHFGEVSDSEVLALLRQGQPTPAPSISPSSASSRPPGGTPCP